MHIYYCFYILYLGLITWQASKIYTNESRRYYRPDHPVPDYPVSDHDMVLYLSCKMSDPTVKVYLQAEEKKDNPKRKHQFKEMAGQQIVIFNPSKMDHFFRPFQLFCIADPSSTTETLPERFEKGTFKLTESMDFSLQLTGG